MRSDQHLRVSDAERERAATELAEHYAQGRLSPEEHGERLDQIWSARTRGELVPVFRDLPGPASAWGLDSVHLRGRAPRGRGLLRRGLPIPLLVVLAVLVVLTVVTHLPLVMLGLVVWFFFVSSHGRGRPRSRV